MLLFFGFQIESLLFFEVDRKYPGTNLCRVTPPPPSLTSASLRYREIPGFGRVIENQPCFLAEENFKQIKNNI